MLGNDNQTFYKQIFKLVAPIVIQNLLSAAVSSADVVMLNYVGQSSISAVSLASQYANILFMVFYGLGTGATMLSAQYFGKGDMKAIQVIEGIALRFSLSIAFLFACLALFVPQPMMQLFTNDRELITIGASYLRFMSVSYLCWGITEVYLAILRSTGKVVVSTAMNVLAFSLNILLNGVFIFGLFGAPKLGAMGVALATSISRLIELMACFGVSFFSKDIKLDFRYMFVGNRALFSDGSGKRYFLGSRFFYVFCYHGAYGDGRCGGKFLCIRGAQLRDGAVLWNRKRGRHLAGKYYRYE